MIKKILHTLIRMVIIAALLYISHQLYIYMTLPAKARFDIQSYTISILVHIIFFFLAGVALRFKLGLITAIKKKSVKVDFAKLGGAVVLLIFLVLTLLFNMLGFSYVLDAIPIIAGVLLADSFEYEKK